MDLHPPYGVYVNCEQVGEYANYLEASAHYEHLRLDSTSPEQRQREKDKKRTALQSPISQTKLRIFYLKDHVEHKSPWFYSNDRANKALEILRAKYGESNAIIYRD